MSIKLYNPRDVPFGPLSNNATYSMSIDGEKYNTVTNYIYANILGAPYSKTLKCLDPREIHTWFNGYDAEHVTKIMLESLDKASDVKFNNQQLRSLLKDTEKYPIFFISDNGLLGVGRDNNGSNEIGKRLMEIRKKIFELDGVFNSKMLNAYIAMSLLEKVRLDKASTLSEYNNLTVDGIINKYVLDEATNLARKNKDDLTALTEMEIISLYRPMITKMYDKNIIAKMAVSLAQTDDRISNIELLHLLELSITNPELLILYIKKKYINSLQDDQRDRIKKEIFNIYVDNILEDKYPNLSPSKYAQAKQEELNVSDSDIKRLTEQVSRLFVNGLLPEKVMRIIKDTVTTTVISDNSINKVKGINMKFIIKLITDKKQSVVVRLNITDTLKDSIFSPLSPYSYTGAMLVIDNYKYPTVMHYVVAKLLSSLPDYKTFRSAYETLLVNKNESGDDRMNFQMIDPLFNTYNDQKFRQYNNLKKTLASIALKLKFQNLGLRKLLDRTGDNDILWNDPHDNVLGIARDKCGENFVGNFLMKIRSEPMSLIITKNAEVADVLQNDVFMRCWASRRLKDMCNSLKEMEAYMNSKNQIQCVIDAKFVGIVLTKIYSACSDIMSSNTDVLTPPNYFSEYVKCNLQNGGSDPMIAEKLWVYVCKLVQYVAQFVNTTANIQNALVMIEGVVSEPTSCEKITGVTRTDCIIRALINIIKKISMFNMEYGMDTTVSIQDVETATNILLNRRGNTAQPLATPCATAFLPDAVQKIIDEAKNRNQAQITQYDDENEEDEEDEEAKEEAKKAEEEYIGKEVFDNLGSDAVEYGKDKPIDDYNPVVQSTLDRIIGNVNNTGAGDTTLSPVIDDDYDNYANDYNDDYNGEYNDEDDYGGYNDEDGARFVVPLKEKQINEVTKAIKDLKSDDHATIAKYIIDAVKVINTFPMDTRVKMNRINFFSS